MKELMKKLWNWLKSLFTSDETKSELIKVVVNNVDSKELSVVQDKDLGAKAIEFVKELNERTDITNEEKAKIFNQKIAEYALQIGKEIGKAAINLLRELAVAAVKILVTKAVVAVLATENKLKEATAK